VAICFHDSHRFGGVERVVYESGKFLSRRGHDVTIFARTCEDDGTGRTTFHEVACADRPAHRLGARFFEACTEALDPEAFDVVTSHGCTAPFDHIHWAHSIHGAWLEVARELRSPWSLDAIKQRLNPVHPVLLGLERRHLAERRYRHVIALTQESADDIHRLYGVPPEDVTLIAPGYSPEDFHPRDRAAKRASIRAELGLDGDTKVVAFVANELLRKGFGPLIRAASASPHRPHVVVVGRVGPGRFASEVRRLGLADRVHWLGKVSSEKLTAVYAASDVFCLPTQYEGWGLVIVEALACGTPVITSRPARANIVIRPGETGEIVEDCDDAGEIGRGLDRWLSRPSPDPVAVSQSVAAWRWERVLERYEDVLYRFARRST
jgi:UDP-glucose:(heptosyl)LPS alpha-1,3-glucosyltransferase